MQAEISFPRVDYSKHPAFALYRSSDGPSAGHIEQCVRNIDDACDRFSIAPSSTQEFDAELARGFESLADLVSQTLPAASAAFAKRHLTAAEATLRELAGFQAKASAYEAKALSSEENRLLLQQMRAAGFCTRLLPADFIFRLNRALERDFEDVRKMAGISPAGRTAKPLAMYQPAALLVKRRLQELRIFEVLNEYLRASMEFYYVALELSRPVQNWYRDCYLDTGLPTSKTVYVHSDADVGMLKAILYLNDVGSDNGPFCYVEGSNRWRRSAFRFAMHRAIDMLTPEDFELLAGDTNYRLGYYRPRFKIPEQRRLLASLPDSFLGSSHFGDDLLDGSPESELILRHERRFLSREENLVFFDGSRGLHRGGLVARGERWALQIGFRASDAPGLARAWLELVGRARAAAARSLRIFRTGD